MAILMEADHLSHSFGKKCVLDNISLQIEEGGVIGLLGPSGAGKTTLVNILTGQIAPAAGEIRTRKEHLAAGIMMDSFGLYERLTVWDNLKIFAAIYQVPDQKIEELLERTELADARKTAVGKLSKGMRNRVNFCRALLKEMDILYLDEPTSGLDPATTEKIHELIRAEKASGTTIFLTTHNMHEAEQLCDSIFLLNEGKIVEQGVPEEICMKYNLENTIEVTLENGERRVLANSGENADTLARMMHEGKIRSIHSSEPDLEQVFLHLTGRKLNGS
ncbi:MAG: ABC transporter ATP-binding protein [Lachnospiraceae bacterium]|nr:ABC transporter ATP-binding protein [Lachnospiraceae bacterium]MCM1240763.1 ABC transporter ATP-binding protein [Lachnospiraceae bacterium]MCM1240822.1 ABC transporter ATP-binding protein [Lachnospiraceae bacterium]